MALRQPLAWLRSVLRNVILTRLEICFFYVYVYFSFHACSKLIISGPKRSIVKRSFSLF